MDLDICMASDDYYAVHLGICIVSIAENNSENINMHILNNNISEININKLKGLEKDYTNLKINFYDIHMYFQKHNINDLIKTKLEKNDFYNLLGISAFSRLFLEDILPPDINKVLYLDADTIVLNDLSKLFEIDLGNNYIGGVVDVMANITKSLYQGDKKSTPFVNSGVLLINLEKWREIGFANLSIDLINNYPDKNYLHDQNIINIICGDNLILLDPKFNVMSEYFYVDYKKNLKVNSYFGLIDEFNLPDQINDAMNNPTVVHFISHVWNRPWISKIGIINHTPKNPYNKCYDYYKNKSPWKNQKIQENNKKLHEKLYFESIRLIMMYFPACLIGLLHYIKNR